MSPVFDFEQDLGCGLSIRHCRCHRIMAAVSERQMLLFFFAEGLVGVDKQTCLSNGFSGNFCDSITGLYSRSITRQCRSYSKT